MSRPAQNSTTMILNLYVDIYEASIAARVIQQSAMLDEVLYRVSESGWTYEDTELACQSVKEAIEEEFTAYDINEYEIELYD